jgi:glycosyltransferase involved in cell wall biosynthesis
VVGDSKFGGGSVIISQIVNSQKSMGYDVSVLTTDSEFISHLHSNGIKTLEVDCIWRSYNLFKDLIGVYRLYSFLKKNNFDVVHTHTTKAGFIGRLAAKLSNSKHIFHTVHGFPFSEDSSYIKVKVFSFLEFFLAKFTDKLIFVSDYHKAWARDLGISGDESKTISIRNGVDCPVIHLDHINKLVDEFGADLKIVFVGRIVKEKGVFELLTAFDVLVKEFSNLKLFFVGTGPDFALLQVKASKSPGVHFTGFVTNPADYLQFSDVFVLPSYREGLSISALEAQSVGTASVLSDVGGNIEISNEGESALIFRLHDIDDLVLKLRILLSSESKRKSLSDSSIINFKNNFTNEKMINGYRQLYENIF